MNRFGARIDSGTIFVTSMLVTYALTRAWLHVQPNTDFNIGPYNIHHLFTGVVILSACGIPALLRPDGKRRPLLVAGFGVGLSLILDEWLYLIVTDGSNAAYVQMPSVVGGGLAVGGACLYAAWLTRRRRGRKQSGSHHAG